jgi:hypothetical protein
MGKWNLSQAFASVGGWGGGRLLLSPHSYGSHLQNSRRHNNLLFVALLVGEVYSKTVLEEKNIRFTTMYTMYTSWNGLG